ASADYYLNVLDQEEVEGFWEQTGLRGGKDDPCFNIDWIAAGKEVVTHPKVDELCEAAAARGGPRAAAATRQKAASLASELAASVEMRFAHFTSALARFGFQRLYSGLVFERQQLLSLAQLSVRAREEGRSIIYLPSHKSHIDYIVLQFSLWNLGLGAPAIAAGENLNLPVVGGLLRRNGAFYIRRSFSGPDSELYTAVVAAYIEGLLKRGANVKFFTEGGRSRSGKLLQPKIGLLGMVLDPILDGVVEDAYIVPVSIYYDGVMETESYVRELSGSQKRKESLIGVLGQGKHLLAMRRSRYGNIHVRFAPGFSARSYIDTHMAVQRQAAPNRANFNPVSTMADKQVLLKALAYHVLEEINRVSSVTPTALVGTVLLCTLGRGIGRRALINKVDWLRREVVRSGGHMSRFYDFPGELTAEVVDSALTVLGNLVQTFTGLVEPVYCVAPGMHFELSYYRNMCVHVFIHQAIITAVLHRAVQMHRQGAGRVERADVMSDVRFLSRLLKREFVFSGSATPGGSPPKQASAEQWGQDAPIALMRNFESALELLVAEGVVGVCESGSKGGAISLEQYRSAQEQGGYDHWNKHFTFLCSMVWPLIESYWLVLASLLYIFRNGIVIIGEKPAVAYMQSFAKTLVHMGYVQYHEAASEEPLRKALQTYSELGIVRWARRTGNQGEPVVALELEPEYRGTGENKFSQLVQLTDEVASYRRCWREQEGPDEYPDYIARLAFGVSKL
ncbi:plsB, partial [Symbiodinium natans]